MAHKKSLLGKYFSESDCRSPRHDGHNWLMPETSLSDPSGEDRNVRTTEAMKSGSTTPDSDVTIIVTSTPVKEKPPPLTFSNVKTMSTETLPSEIFESPDREKQSPSKSPDSSSDDVLNQNLQTMRNALQHSQQMQKKKRFFQEMLQGKNNFYLLNNLIKSKINVSWTESVVLNLNMIICHHLPYQWSSGFTCSAFPHWIKKILS